MRDDAITSDQNCRPVSPAPKSSVSITTGVPQARDRHVDVQQHAAEKGHADYQPCACPTLRLSGDGLQVDRDYAIRSRRKSSGGRIPREKRRKRWRQICVREAGGRC